MSELFVSVFGIHGVVGDSLTPQTACELGLAYAALLAQGGISGPVVVGRDSRPSGVMIEQAVTAGLLDSGNGSGGIAGKMLLEQLECRTLVEHGEPTGRFPRPPEPTAESAKEACRKAAAAGVVAGFVQDADADRVALIDETGRYVGEEYTFALAARAALAARSGPLAASLSTSRMIDDVAATMGVRVVRTAVGEANVAQAIAAHDCVLGGEGNGGVIDPRVSPVHDSIVAIALVLDLVARSGKPLSRLAAELPRYCMMRRKLPVPRDGVGPMLQRVVAAGNGALINDADGIRIDWLEGWAHVRASSTEQAYRVVAEGRDEVDTAKILQHVVAAASASA
ncbi:MAG: hypothetical protein PHU85_15925 [Phycisphaerae bacterium]|nr:hypothetical protein [Phycisphaerae bacterium]